MRTIVLHMIIIGKFGSASVLLKKAPEGTGVIAGGPARAVLRACRYQEYPYKISWIQQQAERSSCNYRRFKQTESSGRSS